MKAILYCLLAGMLFMSCKENDSFSVANKNIVSLDGSVPFEELLLLINLKTTDSTFLAVNSIDSVNIFINNYYWSKVNSQPLDISKINTILVGNQYQSKTKLNYLVIANQDVDEPVFITAGDYAQYMNAVFDLKPGEYACFIESFQITFNDNSIKTYYPYEYTSFKVEQNSRSAFVGEIEIKID